MDMSKEMVKKMVIGALDMSGYQLIHGTRPNTIGISIESSPISILTWIYEKYLSWTDGKCKLSEIITISVTVVHHFFCPIAKIAKNWQLPTYYQMDKFHSWCMVHWNFMYKRQCPVSHNKFWTLFPCTITINQLMVHGT